MRSTILNFRRVRQLSTKAPLLVVALLGFVSVSRAAEDVRPVHVSQVRIEDTFWAPKIKVCQEKMIPHSWFYMQWNLRTLRTLAGEKVEGDLNGTWDEANFYKFLETIGLSLGVVPDKELEKHADEVINLAASVQAPSGFSHAYIINTKKPRWDPEFLDGSHTGYVLGHMIEAAIIYHANTGKKAFLDFARRAADEAYDHFLGPNGKPGFCGHAELELAMVELYRVTGEQRYLDLSKAFIEWRGRGKVKPVGDTPRAYFQDHVPLREQKTLEGHSVRALFFASGVADVALVTGDIDYRLAANRFWDSVAPRRMAITGSTGSSDRHEDFGEDYELPRRAYYESCASCALVDFGERMFLLERRSEYADVMERALYNAVLHGISLSGTNSYYQNPMSDANNPRYNCWVCCPPNLSRTLLKVHRYAYAAGQTNLWMNLYVGGTVTTPVKGGDLSLQIQTEYPWKEDVKVVVKKAPANPLSLYMRIPGWCEKAHMALNGTNCSSLPRTDQGYLLVNRQWKEGDTIDLKFSMPVRRIEAHPGIRDCAGMVALQRGPVVYGFEALDNDGNAKMTLADNDLFETEHRPELLGGVTVIKGKTLEGKPLLAIPFYAMANREKSTQEVWAVQSGFTTNRAWWLSQPYRPYHTVQEAK